MNRIPNAGALVVTGFIKGHSPKDRLDYLLGFIRRLANNQDTRAPALIIGFKGLPGFTVSSLIMELNGSPVGS
jgi:hypothetical protein